VSALDPLLSGCDHVYTHNPWGEYGHEEHVQVCRAVRELKRRHRYRCWHSCYFSLKSERLMKHYDTDGAVPCSASTRNCRLARELEQSYRALGCWTWYDERESYPTEQYFPDLRRGAGVRQADTRGFNEIRPDWGFSRLLETSGGSEQLREFARYAVPSVTAAWSTDDRGATAIVRGNTGASLRLNGPAALLLGLCDGRRSVGEIVNLIGDAYAPGPDGEPAGLYDALAQFRSRGIVRISFASLTDRPVTSRPAARA
jgi:hypothetical protein